MPNRIIRDGILTSERVNELGALEEVFYRRLMSVVDDYGRFEADPQLLRAACFPRRLDTTTDAQVMTWLAACARASLLRVYTVKSASYLQLQDFKQYTRAKKSKYPAPDERPVSDPTADELHGNGECTADAAHDDGDGSTNALPTQSGCESDEEQPKVVSTADALQTHPTRNSSARLYGDGDGDGYGYGYGDGDGKVQKQRASARQRRPRPPPDGLKVLAPPWIDVEAWAMFIAMRSESKHPLTSFGANLVLRKLDRARCAGHDPNAMLAEAVIHGWRSVFPPKTHESPPPQPATVPIFRGDI